MVASLLLGTTYPGAYPVAMWSGSCVVTHDVVTMDSEGSNYFFWRGRMLAGKSGPGEIHFWYGAAMPFCRLVDLTRFCLLSIKRTIMPLMYQSLLFTT